MPAPTLPGLPISAACLSPWPSDGGSGAQIMVKQVRDPTLDREMMNKPHPRSTVIAFFVAFCCMVLPSHARAEAYAVVQAISEPDARGRWRPVQESAAAVRLEGEVRRPLQVGMVVPSARTRRHHPRKVASLVNDPVRQRAIQMSPFGSNREPIAYSW